VIAGSVAVRENEISKETETRAVGTICLSCSDRPLIGVGAKSLRQFPPVEWQTLNMPDVAIHVTPCLVSHE
jgi:hypothetical protein